MALRRFFKKAIQKKLGILRSIGLFRYQAMAFPIFALVRDFLTLPTVRTKNSEDFSALVTRLGLSEADLLERQTWFKRMTSLWLILFGCMLAYSLYLVLKGAWLSVVAVWVISAMMLSQAFQYHFWFFQITQRRCGCTLREWKDFSLSKERTV